MNIQVTGNHPAVPTLSRYLTSLGYQVQGDVSSAPTYTVRIEVGPQTNIVLQGLRGAFAEETLHAVADLTRSPVEWRKAPDGSEFVIDIVAAAAQAEAIERGVLRALLMITGHGAAETAPGGLLGAVSRLWKSGNK